MSDLSLTYEQACEVKQCTRCPASMEGGGTFAYRDGVVVEVFCRECDTARQIANYRTTSRLTSGLLLWAVLRHAGRGNRRMRSDRNDGPIVDELASVNDSLQAMAKEFESRLWFPKLQAQVTASKRSGMSYQGDGFKLLTLCSAARCMLTMEGEGVSFTVITEEKSAEPRMGWQGVDGTVAQVRVLFDRVMGVREAIKLKDDGEVGFG